MLATPRLNGCPAEVSATAAPLVVHTPTRAGRSARKFRLQGRPVVWPRCTNAPVKQRAGTKTINPK